MISVVEKGNENIANVEVFQMFGDVRMLSHVLSLYFKHDMHHGGVDFQGLVSKS